MTKQIPTSLHIATNAIDISILDSYDKAQLQKIDAVVKAAVAYCEADIKAASSPDVTIHSIAVHRAVDALMGETK